MDRQRNREFKLEAERLIEQDKFGAAAALEFDIPRH